MTSSRTGRTGSRRRRRTYAVIPGRCDSIELWGAIAPLRISRYELQIPGSRGACHRAALRADPLARPGMTARIVENITPHANVRNCGGSEVIFRQVLFPNHLL